MSRFTRELRELWRPLDPARDCGLPDTGVREAGLRRIIGAPLDGALPVALPPRVGRLRRTVFAAAGAVAAGGVLVVANPAQGPAFAATPAPLVAEGASGTAGAALREIAERTAGAPETRGDIDWLRLHSWSLTARVTDDATRSAVIPQELVIERRADGSATVTTALEEPLVQRGGIRDRIAVWWKVTTDDPKVTTYGPGQYPSSWAPTERPPADPAKLRSWLLFDGPVEGGQLMRAIDELAAERVLSSEERRALLTMLAGVEGVRLDGAVTDRAGRRGTAFSLESAAFGLPTRFTLVVDPQTGALLASEQTLEKERGVYDVRLPAVIQYKLYGVAGD